MPITLQLHSKNYNQIPSEGPIALKSRTTNDVIAIMYVERVEKLSELNSRLINWFGTENKDHPGLIDLYSRGDMLLSGLFSL